MAKARKFLQYDKSLKLWFARVYPTRPSRRRQVHGKPHRIPYPNGDANGKPRKIYLSGDKAIAEQLAKLIYIPYVEGDYDECKRRVDMANDRLKRIGNNDSFLHSLIVDQQWSDLDDYDSELEDYVGVGDIKPKQSKLLLAGVQDTIDEFDMSNDKDRLHLDDAADAILKLDERPDLVSEFLTLAIGMGDREVLTDVQDEINKRLGTNGRKPIAAEQLSDCIAPWKQRVEAKKRTAEHISAYRAAYEDFVDFTDDPHICELRKRHFVDYQNHIDQACDGLSTKTRNDKLKPIKTILREARRLTEWTFPPQLDLWLSVLEYSEYEPDPDNAEPMSVEHFKALLAQANEWAAIDPYAQAEKKRSRPAVANAIKQANRLKRRGLQWGAILRLAVNVAAENQDIAGVGYKHLLLDDELPLFTLRRKKNKVDRRTPMLPSTIRAIKRWRDYQPEIQGCVFSNDASRPFNSKTLSKDFRRLCAAAKMPDGSPVPIWVEFKTCRNVAGTVGKRRGRPSDERSAIRGHKVNGVGRFYEGDVGDDYLVQLVNLIGAEYFDGESVV